ncbi:hypothetical protein LMG27198_51570 [Methylocystis echinoides]|uniref:Uncharacterized protein n=1 Tax=Methylocystis echinoides TaxID=29468 RepID=A0A9W6H078_9HYPH|nr:hypothetical protein LMG27198_51570 [Methylocystis echinoides]
MTGISNIRLRLRARGWLDRIRVGGRAVMAGIPSVRRRVLDMFRRHPAPNRSLASLPVIRFGGSGLDLQVSCRC